MAIFLLQPPLHEMTNEQTWGRQGSGEKADRKRQMIEWQHKWPHTMSVSSQKHTITIQVRWVKEMSEWKDTCLDEAAQMTDQCNETKSWMTYQKCIMGAASDIQSMRRALGMLKPQPANDQHVYNDHTTITYCMYSSLSQGTRTHNVERKHNNNTPWHRLWLLMYTYNLDQSRRKKNRKKIIQNKRENTLHLFLKYKTKTARTTHIQKNKTKKTYDTYSYCRCFDCEFIHASFSYLSTTTLPLNGYAPLLHVVIIPHWGCHEEK